MHVLKYICMVDTDYRLRITGSNTRCDIYFLFSEYIDLFINYIFSNAWNNNNRKNNQLLLPFMTNINNKKIPINNHAEIDIHKISEYIGLQLTRIIMQEYVPT